MLIRSLVTVNLFDMPGVQKDGILDASGIMRAIEGYDHIRIVIPAVEKSYAPVPMGVAHKNIVMRGRVEICGAKSFTLTAEAPDARMHLIGLDTGFYVFGAELGEGENRPYVSALDWRTPGQPATPDVSPPKCGLSLARNAAGERCTQPRVRWQIDGPWRDFACGNFGMELADYSGSLFSCPTAYALWMDTDRYGHTMSGWSARNAKFLSYETGCPIGCRGLVTDGYLDDTNWYGTKTGGNQTDIVQIFDGKPVMIGGVAHPGTPHKIVFGGNPEGPGKDIASWSATAPSAAKITATPWAVDYNVRAVTKVGTPIPALPA